MEKFSMNNFGNVIEQKSKKNEKDIFERVSIHSQEFDKEILAKPDVSSEEVREAWQIREWKIGDTVIRAIGVAHVPETFLEFRQEIENVIKESDVVVNEFAPEALGFYDKESASKLQSIKSTFNENYNLEQLRQAYLKYERQYNLGLFHHEIELLAAKYGKDMALADLSLSMDVESFLKDDTLYARGAEQIERKKALYKKGGLEVGTFLLSVASFINFVEELKQPVAMMSRRKFIKNGLIVGASLALAGLPSKIVKIPQKTSANKETEIDDKKKYTQLVLLRDPKLADSLIKLAEMGYKKVAFIYGVGHLDGVEKYINNPELASMELNDNEDIINRNNPNAFRIYKLSPGNNTSGRFVASEKMIWKPIAK
ncbi:MAG: hypothetical protein Q8L10_01245 [Candidatus Moranbacteria bacterium]|nr:hypothetical protein [Candidatus Moranbacteria bacterium]